MKTLLLRLSQWCSAKLPPQAYCSGAHSKESRTPLLIVVEGPHDVEFLRRVSAILHRHDAKLPDLARAEAAGQLAFLPAGGGNLWAWSHRLTAFEAFEFHLYDRETSPVSEQRQQLVDAINIRPNCQAVLTRKRALENYLHPLAIQQAGGVHIQFTDDDSVPLLVAQSAYRLHGSDVAWADLSQRARKRRCERAKAWLNRRAVECMTAELLSDRDPAGEVASWLGIIATLLAAGR